MRLALCRYVLMPVTEVAEFENIGIIDQQARELAIFVGHSAVVAIRHQNIDTCQWFALLVKNLALDLALWGLRLGLLWLGL